ncbi:Hypothetical Protein FCC1311_069942 [Hondaea fermentalgiana]|uniref:Apple domain-containing protein n=1 Tax=Hondaea fermentalgiana TaxID=2315210 RepID=A0A2R5GSC0_9STRA|nr:Hypothetical Protein FCC1311_069942 [Hondaea fermentalgiana]|eukprot:GBG30774.1 Hypothetical Protein FCC1311_069942 [Hondaea fermentalgiana]
MSLAMDRFCILVAGLLLAICVGVEASSTSSRCVEGFYFHDGWCLGLANRDKKKRWRHQFLDEDYSFCQKRFAHGRDIQPATITNEGQLEALQKVLDGEDLPWAFLGWAPPQDYRGGSIKKLEAPRLDMKKTPKALKNMLGVDIDVSSCSGRTEYYSESDYTGGDTYAEEFYSNNYGTYSSKGSKYNSYTSDSYAYDNEYSDEYSAGCNRKSKLIMTRSGDVTVSTNSWSTDSYAKSSPVCMYEVPERKESKTCPQLLGNGYCRFAKPTDLRETDYDGDSSNRENISEEECYKKCVNFAYCKAYEFYGKNREKGTCEMHFDTPVRIKTTSSHKLTHCAVLVEDQDCSDEVTFATPAPTPAPTRSPTPFPTSRPTKPTPSPTLATIPDNVDEYPSCPNNMILAQCFKPECEKKCGDRKLNGKCSKKADRVCIDLPDPKSSYSYDAEATFIETYCRCPEGLIKDTASRKCVKKGKECPPAIAAWTDKCQEDDDNVVVDLTTIGSWTKLETNVAKKYENNADLCWIIRAPAGKKVILQVEGGGKSQAKKDVLEVWDVLSPSEATFDALSSGDVDTELRETFDGKVKRRTTLDAESQQMVVHFYSDKKKVQTGFDFWAMYV